MGIAKPEAKAKGGAKPVQNIDLPSASPSPPAARGFGLIRGLAASPGPAFSNSAPTMASLESPSKQESQTSEQLTPGAEDGLGKSLRGRPRIVVDLTSGAQKIHDGIKTEVFALELPISELYEVK